MQEAFYEEFRSQIQTKAAWVGIKHPHYGDMYWAFGDAVIDTIPATIDDHFYIGSISKTFGATVTIRLSEQGYFSLEDTIESIDPEFTTQFPEYRDYKVTDLLSMQTLIPDYFNVQDGLLKDLLDNPEKRYKIAEVVEFALKDGLNEEVGYSSTNFLVLEHIAEKVTGCSMPELVKQYATNPTGLKNTVEPSRFSYGTLPHPKAKSYAGDSCVFEYNMVGAGGEIEFGDDISDEADLIVVAGTSGTIYSTIKDLLQWGRAGAGDILLSNSNRFKRHQFKPTEGGVLVYSLGLYQITSENDIIWYGHDGDALGSAAYVLKSDELNAVFAGGVTTCSFLSLLQTFHKIFEDDLIANPAPSYCHEEEIKRHRRHTKRRRGGGNNHDHHRNGGYGKKGKKGKR